MKIDKKKIQSIYNAARTSQTKILFLEKATVVIDEDGVAVFMDKDGNPYLWMTGDTYKKFLRETNED